MSDRFFSSAPITSDGVTLDGPEAHHLLHVMRVKVGDEVTLFDNSGREFRATVEKLGRSTADLLVTEHIDTDHELPFSLIVGVALPKGDRQKWLVEKLTELGVTALVPLETERGVAQPTASAIERLERASIEAAKQCGRNRLLQIRPPIPFDEWLEGPDSAFGSPDSAFRRFIAHPNGSPLSAIELFPARDTALAIGSEGGFTDSEVNDATSAGWQPVSLGPRILRIETAAIALAAAITLR